MERTIRNTKKREAILHAIQNTGCHPSAEWVYQTLKPTHPNLSLGTVYRNLLFFKDQGTIKSVGVINGQERFDGITTPHSHFVCSRCGAVVDLKELSLDSDLNHSVSEQYQFLVERHELTFYGICQQCMQNKNDQEEVKV